MKDWSADKILAVGMALAFLLTVIGSDAVAVMNGDMSIAALGKEIAIGLFGYMGRGGLQTVSGQQQNQPAQQNQTAQTLEQVANVATQGQQIANAVDAIQDVLKPKK